MAVIYRGRRLPAAFGSFVSFGVWRKLQPQNLARQEFEAGVQVIWALRSAPFRDMFYTPRIALTIHEAWRS